MQSWVKLLPDQSMMSYQLQRKRHVFYFKNPAGYYAPAHDQAPGRWYGRRRRPRRQQGQGRTGRFDATGPAAYGEYAYVRSQHLRLDPRFARRWGRIAPGN